jgi:hypothetical protein
MQARNMIIRPFSPLSSSYARNGNSVTNKSAIRKLFWDHFADATNQFNPDIQNSTKIATIFTRVQLLSATRASDTAELTLKRKLFIGVR